MGVPGPVPAGPEAPWTSAEQGHCKVLEAERLTRAMLKGSLIFSQEAPGLHQAPHIREAAAVRFTIMSVGQKKTFDKNLHLFMHDKTATTVVMDLVGLQDSSSV